MGTIAEETFEDFARSLFADEYCAECGGDWYDHEPWGVLGNWFAHCKVETFCLIDDRPDTLPPLRPAYVVIDFADGEGVTA